MHVHTSIYCVTLAIDKYFTQAFAMHIIIEIYLIIVHEVFSYYLI